MLLYLKTAFIGCLLKNLPSYWRVASMPDKKPPRERCRLFSLLLKKKEQNTVEAKHWTNIVNRVRVEGNAKVDRISEMTTFLFVVHDVRTWKPRRESRHIISGPPQSQTPGERERETPFKDKTRDTKRIRRKAAAREVVPKLCQMGGEVFIVLCRKRRWREGVKG